MEDLGYMPQYVNTAGVQVLETLEILTTSKVLKTVKSRYEFLAQTLPILQTAASNPRYPIDLQQAIDRYHTMYYDKQPTEEALAVLREPNRLILPELYCRSVVRCMAVHLNEELEEIRTLKRASAVDRRTAKLFELFTLANAELDLECQSTATYSSAKQSLRDLQSQLAPNPNPAQP